MLVTSPHVTYVNLDHIPIVYNPVILMVKYRFNLSASIRNYHEGGRTFLLVLKKLQFCHFYFFSDFDFFFVWIHCLVIGLLQPVTKYMLFGN